MELARAARQYLAEKEDPDGDGIFTFVRSDLTGLLGSDTTWDTWIFRYALPVTVEGSESVAVVLSVRGSYTSPNGHNTQRFPRLQVEVFADPPRNTERNPEDNFSPEEKIEAVFVVLDRYLHTVNLDVPDIDPKTGKPWDPPNPRQGGALYWGPERIIGSERLGEPEVSEVPEGDGMVRGLWSYGVNRG